MNLRHSIQRYINRSFLLHRVGNPSYYNTASRLKSLDRLRILQTHLSVAGEAYLPKLVLRFHKDLFQVLPYHTNSSFQKSKNRLEATINECHARIHFQTVKHED